MDSRDKREDISLADIYLNLIHLVAKTRRGRDERSRSKMVLSSFAASCIYPRGVRRINDVDDGHTAVIIVSIDRSQSFLSGEGERFLCRVSTLKPMVGIVFTISPSLRGERSGAGEKD